MRKKITWGSPFSWKGPQFNIKLGTLGSPKYYEIGDGGPHFGGSPFSYDTGVKILTHQIFELDPLTAPKI